MRTVNSDEKMRRTLRLKDIVILAFSTMIGWGWVSLTGNWSSEGGMIGAAMAFAIGAVMCIFVGLVYAELTAMLPFAGGELVFSYKAMGYTAAWFTGWMITFAYVGVAAWEGPALATAIDYIIPIPRYGYMYTIADFDLYLSWLIIPMVVGLFLIYINFKGIAFSARFQAIVTVILAIGGLVFAILGVLKGKIVNATPVVTSSSGVFAVVLAVPAMFVGFDVIPQAAEEMNVPIKKIPKAIIASICMAAAWYIVMIVSASIQAPVSVLQQEGLSVVNAVNYSTNNTFAGKLIIVSAIMGIMTSWNGFIIGATRVLYSMGRARMLPIAFGTLHEKYKTPFFATIFIGTITIMTPLLGKNSLAWFVDASSFGTVIAYFMVSLSFILLRKDTKIIRPYKVKHGNFVGIVAVMITIFFISLYMPIGPSSLTRIEWFIVGAWLGLGIILYLGGLKNKEIYREERESRLLGEISAK